MNHTSTPLAFDPYDFSQTEVNNIPVYYKKLPWAPCVHIYISFNIGAFQDPVGKEGLSHFLEHMIFDGSPSLPDRKAVRTWSKTEALGSWNGYTSHNNTAYHLRCLPEKFNDVLNLMKEQIFYPLLRDEDVEHERKVITQEAWGRYQNEKLLNYIKEYSAQVFPGHSLSRVSSALGWPDTVAAISADDIRNWHKEKYHTGNMTIIVNGNLDDSLIDTLKNTFNNLPTATKKESISESIPLPLIKEIIKTGDEIGVVKEQVEISISAYKNKPLTPSEHERSFSNLLRDVLYEKMRQEESLCYGVSVSTHRSVNDLSFGIDVKTSVEHIDIVKKITHTEIENILNTDIYKDRFTEIQKTTLEQIRAEEHDSEDIISNATHQLTSNKVIKTMTQNITNREAMNFEDMQKAGTYLYDKDYLVTEIILPSKK